MATASEYWDQLSQSSKQALRWASVVTAQRHGADPATSSHPVGSDDLLIGLVLSHPDGGEAAAILEHVGSGLRPVLASDFPELDLARLAELARHSPRDAQPELDPEAEAIVRRGVDLGLSSGSDEVAELRALVGGLLQASTPTTTRLHTLLWSAGIDPSELANAYLDYLRDPSADGDLGAMLRERFARRPISIPDYKADHVGVRGDSDDLLGIQTEVDALAYLLASRGLTPPLAVGLFGAWGSGKSFFMRAIRRRIEQLITSPEAAGQPQSALPFWKDVVQVEFNAWHYVEGSLWASLVEHIFTHLTITSQDEPKVLADRRQELLDGLDRIARERTLAQTRRQQVEAQLAERRRAAREAARVRDLKQRQLIDARAQAFQDRLDARSLEEIAELAPGAISGAEGHPLKPAAEVLTALAESRELIVSGRRLLGPFLSGGWRTAASIAAVALVPVVVGWLQALGVAASTQLAGGVATTLASVAGILGAANRYARDRLVRIEKARHDVEEAQRLAESQLDETVETALAEVEQAEQDLREARLAEDVLSDEADRLEAELATLTPTSVLTDFVSERARTDDYRRHLGVAALIRKDFEQLADLVRLHNDAAASDEDDGRVAINRIILYIDDLDRCPPEQVVDVLQAVHLLLAFDLFVVVVAVDSRWLSDALLDRLPTLSSAAEAAWEDPPPGADARGRPSGEPVAPPGVTTNGTAPDGPSHATPNDYLEKIFQLPFWVRPLEEGGRRDLIQGLLGPNLVRPDGVGEADPTDAGLDFSGGRRDRLRGLLAREGRPRLETQTLAVTREELDFLDGLAPLLPDTPRSVKRFINVYQLMVGLPVIATGDEEQPPARFLAAFLAAVNEGAPAFSRSLLAAPATPPDGTIRLGALVDGEYDPGSDHARVADWLEQNGPWKDLDVARFAPVVSLVRRLSFTSPDQPI